MNSEDFQLIDKPEYGLTVPTILVKDRELIFFQALKLVEQINKFYDLCGSIGLESDGMLPCLELAVGELEDFSENKLCIETNDERHSRMYYDKQVTEDEFRYMEKEG
jgi:hypothetical protein